MANANARPRSIKLLKMWTKYCSEIYVPYTLGDILKVGHPGITWEQPISCARRPLCMVAFQRMGGSSGWLDLNSVPIRHFSNRAVKQNGRK